jgi:hypothetical protein
MAASQAEPLAIMLERSKTLAARVRSKELTLQDAVDFAYSAADFAGLVERYGDDRIQEVLVLAFMGPRR